ncbi:MAG: hypothetical protein FWE14_11985 [Lachnospiraceae bacterium]|nr:hypothetical protein [Lachnospiraceae bacterium]
MTNGGINYKSSEELWVLGSVCTAYNTPTTIDKHCCEVIKELKIRGEINDADEQKAIRAMKEIYAVQKRSLNVKPLVSAIRKEMRDYACN